jgi:hypothetical protein
LQFHYRLDADMARLRVPARCEPRQVDELWKHTCFEAFVAAARELQRADGAPLIEAYRELNFAPSTEWAAYDFSGYRKGMTPVAMAPPDICVEATHDSLELTARLDPGTSGPLKVSLTAVLEDDAGAITYWALRHAPGRPDFHHPAGFILEV